MNDEQRRMGRMWGGSWESVWGFWGMSAWREVSGVVLSRGSALGGLGGMKRDEKRADGRSCPLLCMGLRSRT